VQPDFVAECSALQHMVEERVPLTRSFEPLAGHTNSVTAARHLCLFLPKARSPPSYLLTPALHARSLVHPPTHPAPTRSPARLQFHCELNWIERMWGAAKAYARTHCLYTIPGLRETVPLALSQDLTDVPADGAPVSPLYLQRRWARISRQFGIEYLKGADVCEVMGLVAQKRSSRHRDPNDRRSAKVEAAMAAASGGGIEGV
jgi:hypothetical protein